MVFDIYNKMATALQKNDISVPDPVMLDPEINRDPATTDINEENEQMLDNQIARERLRLAQIEARMERERQQHETRMALMRQQHEQAMAFLQQNGGGGFNIGNVGERPVRRRRLVLERARQREAERQRRRQERRERERGGGRGRGRNVNRQLRL